MCVAFWTFDDPDYALILCSNRDEFLNRPTVNACFHSFRHHGHQKASHEAESKYSSGGSNDSLNNILSGIDEVGGGTWLGMTRSGKVALLTNITEPPSAFTSSRGSLVSSFLLSERDTQASSCNTDSPSDLEELACRLYPRDAKFAGFNLLLLAPTASRASNTGASTIADELSGISSALAPGEMANQPGRTCQTSNDRTTRVSLPTPALFETQSQPQSRSLHYNSLFLTNSGAGGPITARPLCAQEKRCGGLSNGVDGHGGNEWPKVIHGVEEMEKLILELRQSQNDRNERVVFLPESTKTSLVDDNDEDSEREAQDRRLADRLFEILTWQSPEPVTERPHLRRTIHVSPIPVQLKPGKVNSATDQDLSAGQKAIPVPAPPSLSAEPHVELSANSSPVVPVPSSSPALNDSTHSSPSTEIEEHNAKPEVLVNSSKYYGTRLSNVLLVRRNGDVMFVERDIWKMENSEVVKMNKDSERVFRFKLDGW
ncbi:hypothetical protein VKT23_007877 [Stygiomarasmius scandens]|uniref:DUF833-domain-containing protein n=1 Tax=Marasmiellus scandens TaxID=2682957 RepID=A0ABR1JP41_9AGAR